MSTERSQATRARKLPVINDAEITTAHSVRLLRGCCLCGGLGMKGAMISMGDKALAHTVCVLRKHGFRFATRLPLSERDKFRVGDLTVRQMRHLLDLRSKPDARGHALDCNCSACRVALRQVAHARKHGRSFLR